MTVPFMCNFGEAYLTNSRTIFESLIFHISHPSKAIFGRKKETYKFRCCTILLFVTMFCHSVFTCYYSVIRA